MMPLHRVFSILFCATGLSVICSPAIAQQGGRWNEGPGDIVIVRDVPRQNGVLVGEPGQPTLVNPKTAMAGTSVFLPGAGMFTQPLSDLEAEAVRGTRILGNDKPGGPMGAFASDDVGRGSFSGGQIPGQDRTGFVGGTVSGAVGGATRQIQGVLSDALGRGRL